MIRFMFALSPVLLASLMVPPIALGQEPVKARPSNGPSLPESLKRLDLEDQAYTRSYFQAQTMAMRPDALETNFGLSLSDADETLRAQLEIAPGEGVVVVGVKAGSLAEHAGLKLNDVLLVLGGHPAKGVDEVRKVLLGLGKEALEVRLIREGKAQRMSLVGPEHGFPPEAAEYWIGVPVSPVDATLRAHLTSLPADSGLVVNDVVKGSPADQVSVKKDDILVAMGGKPLRNSDALIAQIQASQGKAVPLEILRAGKPMTIAVTPARRAYPTVIKYRTNPNQEFNFQVVRPDLAIGAEPIYQWLVANQPATQGKVVESRIPNSDRVTLYAPYSGIVNNPYSGVQPFAPNFPGQPTQFPQYPAPGLAEPSAARIEGQLKEVMAKLEEITQALEGLRKTVEKK